MEALRLRIRHANEELAKERRRLERLTDESVVIASRLRRFLSTQDGLFMPVNTSVDTRAPSATP